MNKLLFVDDDYIIIRSYLHAVPWDNLGISAVFSATNAEEAKRIIIQEQPNVMICDIEMPGLSGIELTEWVQQAGYNLKVIYLSAYDDFRYAQIAVKQNCVEYLLKPVSVEELSAAVGRAIDSYDRELHREEYAVLAKYWMNHCDVVYEEYWKAVINGNLSTDAEMEREAESSGIRLFPESGCAVFLFCVEPGEAGVPPSPKLLDDLLGVARSYFTKQANDTYVIHLDQELCAAILLNGSHDIEEGCRGLETLAHEELSVPVMILGRHCDAPAQIKAAMDSLFLQMERRLADASNMKRVSLVDRIRLYVAENLTTELSKNSVAKYVSMNPDYVSKLFKKETGQSIPEYITEQKLLRARRMLLQTDKSIGEIAAYMGYTNFSYFTKLFSRRFGLTPKEYRRQYAAEAQIPHRRSKPLLP